MAKMKKKARIREVWASNLLQEIDELSRAVGENDHIALDTEFPGVVIRMVANDGGDANYQTVRRNVDVLKLIQLGLTVASTPPTTSQSLSNNGSNAGSDTTLPSSAPATASTTSGDVSTNSANPTESVAETRGKKGNEGHDTTTWQFNFSFCLSTDLYAPDSIELLQNSGVDFNALERDGIDPTIFGDLLTTSGLVCNEAIQWVSFHGSYDFAYLTKTLVSQPLPRTEPEFFDMLRVLFPRRYDLKCLVRREQRGRDRERRDVNSNKKAVQLHGGLNRIAESLGCQRTGAVHQAGSDSLLTLDVFMRVRDEVLDGVVDDKDLGKIFGLGNAKR